MSQLKSEGVSELESEKLKLNTSGKPHNEATLLLPCRARRTRALCSLRFQCCCTNFQTPEIWMIDESYQKKDLKSLARVHQCLCPPVSHSKPHAWLLHNRHTQQSRSCGRYGLQGRSRTLWGLCVVWQALHVLHLRSIVEEIGFVCLQN